MPLLSFLCGALVACCPRASLDADQLAAATEPIAEHVQALSEETRARLSAVEGSLAKLLSLISDAVGDQEG